MSSSGQVDLSRHFHFKYAKKTLPEDVIPIISANMDTIGTFEMAIALSEVTLCINYNLVCFEGRG